MTGQAQTEIWEAPSELPLIQLKLWENHFEGQNQGGEKQVAQRGCQVSWYSKHNWMLTCVTCSRELALAGGGTRWSPKVPFQPLQICNSVILWHTGLQITQFRISEVLVLLWLWNVRPVLNQCKRWICQDCESGEINTTMHHSLSGSWKKKR